MEAAGIEPAFSAVGL